MTSEVEVATLAGGCFWCLEAVYDLLDAVQSVESGYMGGKVPNPTYEAVCGGRTGHAEVVRVAFDPGTISYEEILGVFFSTHDPTTLNRQGNDVGTQYRSAIFFHSPQQERIARQVVAKLEREKLFSKPIVTEIVAATEFYVAEKYHQEYYARMGGSNPYCTFVIDPKVAKFRKQYLSRLKK
jgi:peptide-methionine (S)-S-oxide reductase